MSQWASITAEFDDLDALTDDERTTLASLSSEGESGILIWQAGTQLVVEHRCRDWCSEPFAYRDGHVEASSTDRAITWFTTVAARASTAAIRITPDYDDDHIRARKNADGTFERTNTTWVPLPCGHE